MGPLISTPPEPVRLRDAVWSLAVGLAAWALFVATPISRVFGDGSMLISLFSAREFGAAVYIHALYLPLARLLEDLTGALGLAHDPAATLLLLSQLSGAIGVAASFLVARGLGVGRHAALAATALLALSPPIWFFADTTEVHAPHFALVALVALVTLFGPWRRPVLATLFMAACLPLVFLSHQSGLLLFPGWLLLAQVGRCRVAPAFSLRALLLGIGPAIAAALALAILLGARMRDLPLEASLASSSKQISAHMQGHFLNGLWSGWLKPLALLWLPVLLGVFHVLRRRETLPLCAAALAALILPSLAFFLVWGVPERGAYSLGTAPFFCALAGIGFEALLARPKRSLAWPALAVVALIALQGLGARREVLAFDRPELKSRTELRAQAASAAFEGEPTPHLLITIDPDAQAIAKAAPELHELSLIPTLKVCLQKDLPPADFVTRSLALLALLEDSVHPSVALDRSYITELAHFPGSERYTQALEAALAARYQVHPVEGLGGGIWLFK